MKNVKRFIALLMAVTLVFSLSVTAFAEALVNTTKTYQGVVKVLDAEGNVVETVKEGDTVYLAIYFQKKADTSVSIDLVADGSSLLKYELDVPGDMFANKAELSGAKDTAFNAVEGEAVITDWISSTGCFTIFNQIDVTGGITIDPTQPIDKHEITIGAAGTYSLSFYSFNAQSAKVPAKSITKVGTTLTVEAAGGNDTPEFEAETPVVDVKNGDVTYDDAVKVCATISPCGATKAGMEFIPEKVWEDGESWAKARKAYVANDAIGTGDIEINAILVGVPDNLADSIVILSRAFVEVGGEILTGAEKTATLIFNK